MTEKPNFPLQNYLYFFLNKFTSLNSYVILKYKQ